MHPRREAVGCLGIDRSLLHDTAERDLQMLLRATEAVIETDIAVGRIDIVSPQQARDPPPGPHTFRGAGAAWKLGVGFLIFGNRPRFGAFLLGLGLGLIGGLRLTLGLIVRLLLALESGRRVRFVPGRTG